jgi:Domain of unknown function (DUF4124)
MNRRFIPAFTLLLALPAAAQSIYKCVDAAGNTLISNARMDKNCKTVVSGPDMSMPAPKAKAGGAGRYPEGARQ